MFGIVASYIFNSFQRRSRVTIWQVHTRVHMVSKTLYKITFLLSFTTVYISAVYRLVYNRLERLDIIKLLKTGTVKICVSETKINPASSLLSAIFMIIFKVFLKLWNSLHLFKKIK